MLGYIQASCSPAIHTKNGQHIGNPDHHVADRLGALKK